MRAHKQIYFDISLPYDKEKFKLFAPVLPSDKFVPITERKPDESKPPALIKIAERENDFEKRLEKMQKRLHQGHDAKLRILQMCHERKQESLE